MSPPEGPIARLVAKTRADWRALLHHGPGHVQFWLIALCVGIAAGYATLAFRWAISTLQHALYGADDLTLASHAAGLDWYWLVGIPVLGGLTVGAILHHFTPDGRVRSVAHVIEGAALRDGRVERRAGKASVLASIITLSSGGSTGREGPVVHMGAAISTAVADFLRVDGVTARDLMGCAVASAVAASFNAPLAGAIFALEVVLRHHNVHAFAPIAIASVAGAVIGRIHIGDETEFSVPTNLLSFYLEIPAFMLLGVVSGVVAAVMVKSIFLADDTATEVWRRVGMPTWLRPGVAGLFLGLLALGFPHIIGVGYETTYAALSGSLTLQTAIVFATIKVVAVAITIGGRMGGGVFSPALMLGALTGLAFGHLATALVPEMSGAVTVYALAGMAAVAASVLGAPISTTLIAFELTGDWQVGIAVMAAVSLSTFVSDGMLHRSFFLSQLERWGVHIASGPQAYLLSTIGVGRIMRRGETPDAAAEEAIAQGAFVQVDATLETVMPRLEMAPETPVPVVDGERRYLGLLHYTDALKAYADAMAATAREEHG